MFKMKRTPVHINRLLLLGCAYLIFLLPLTLARIPNCEFHDTVNITGSLRYNNGSYLHDGVIIPPKLIGEYDYEVLYDGLELTVGKHVRGCICKLKPCVKLCCRPKQIKKENLRECEIDAKTELELSPYVNITFSNGTEQSIHVLEEFYVQHGIPCYDAYKLTPDSEEDDEWKLFENGTLMRLFDNALMTKRDYCLTPHEVNGVYLLTPMNCPNYEEQSNNHFANNLAMLISIPFLVLTIFVYIFIPKLRNLHGKCLICYLFSLTVGYSVLVTNNYFSKQYNDFTCSFVGFMAYFFFIAAFLWLSVISFDLWHNFRGTSCNVNRYMQNKRFVIYSLYAWGIAGILTFATIQGQLSSIDNHIKPGIGDEYCWLKTDDWSAMIYFYGPIMLLILFNVIMFILTATKIYQVKRDLERIVARENDQRCLRSEKENFGLFLRLFIVMGITWMLEVMSYLVGSDNTWSIFFYVPDFCNAAQGIIIFVLFVLKKKVKKLIKKRILHNEKSTYASNSSSTQSECAPEEISLQNFAKDGKNSNLE
ncbi:G-protein coupled receptor Mth2-like isoform X1 [Teleopsis dalmanni]|uniref:G-protein coupled receptor Mth2-like isoform X1 n=1 Tax=Teleopsis dalmanni TaxID=139649 RepID=UPI0018CF39E3|nr:G-protein coupled receptor Mth2-like isoform X1 [Teleopsis dalmanni]